MGIIRVLPEQIANKIAAGEVIERPASIIKELVENSLDAEAASVEIFIQHGGKSLIRVADDGCGMSREDAELALQRHATSKITSAEDLDHIQSFGFRGEALPSIAAVSRMKLITRPKGAVSGTEIIFEGGRKVSCQPTACREGTVIEVRDLFFNTPARRKFVRTDATEMGHVMDTVLRFGLALPHLAFSLKSSDKTLLDLMAGENLITRAGAFFGNEVSSHLLEIEGQGAGIRITGLIGKPSAARANRNGQVFFINRRWVKALSLGYAVQDGYHGLL
ncbi:MAG TPA: DNA mismatch repair endonuclease MutL, partial [bacterium]|nr:DNA mismatch repair endonuclease MutL [bacterium]